MIYLHVENAISYTISLYAKGKGKLVWRGILTHQGGSISPHRLVQGFSMARSQVPEPTFGIDIIDQRRSFLHQEMNFYDHV